MTDESNLRDAVELSSEEVDFLLEKFDETPKRLQRQIVANLMVELESLRAQLAAEHPADDDTEVSVDWIRSIANDPQSR